MPPGGPLIDGDPARPARRPGGDGKLAALLGPVAMALGENDRQNLLAAFAPPVGVFRLGPERRAASTASRGRRNRSPRAVRSRRPEAPGGG